MVYKIPPNKVNGQRLKHFFEPFSVEEELVETLDDPVYVPPEGET